MYFLKLNTNLIYLHTRGFIYHFILKTLLSKNLPITYQTECFSSKSMRKLGDKLSEKSLNLELKGLAEKAKMATSNNESYQLNQNESLSKLDNFYREQQTKQPKDSFYNFPDTQSESQDFSFSARKKLYGNHTHEQINMLQERYRKKCFLDKKILFYKRNFEPNPELEARFLIESKKEEIPLPSIDPVIVDDNDEILNKSLSEETLKKQEIASRIRTKIRREKLANASIMHASIPNVSGHILDPIKYHSQRRSLRVSSLLKTHLEEILTWNSPKILYGVLKGLAISIHHLELKTTRSTCKIYYTISSNHTPYEAQKRLDQAAPQLRFQLARSLELGYTPQLKFINNSVTFSLNKYRLASLN